VCNRQGRRAAGRGERHSERLTAARATACTARQKTDRQKFTLDIATHKAGKGNGGLWVLNRLQCFSRHDDHY
jgi:hypothetical protein